MFWKGGVAEVLTRNDERERDLEEKEEEEEGEKEEEEEEEEDADDASVTSIGEEKEERGREGGGWKEIAAHFAASRQISSTF